jgi:hypothetical protein
MSTVNYVHQLHSGIYVAWWRHPRAVMCVLALAICGTLLGNHFLLENRAGPQGPMEIFQGITYGRQRLEPTDEGDGLLFWVRIDLSAPGIELYVTPLDPTAVAEGWQYRLRWIRDVVKRERLAVAINGTLFASNSRWRPRLPRDLAKGVETVVADHVISHVWEHAYLLWFAVVRRSVDTAFGAIEAAEARRSCEGEMGNWRTGRLVTG